MPEPRVALITGANRGLGRAVAAELYRRNLSVVVTARREEDAVATAAEIGDGVRWQVLDVTDADSVKAARDAVGSVDVLVSNAGVNLELEAGVDPLTVPLEVVEQTIAINLLGSWRVSQAFMPDMVSRGWGRVVFVSSAIGSFTVGLFPGVPGYSVSKAGVNGLTTMLAKQTQGTGVLVNAVNPGPTRTRMTPDADRSPEDAAVDIADAATLPDDGPTGVFLRGDRRLGW